MVCSNPSSPPLVRYSTEAEYKIHYERKYCARGVVIRTFDGIRVYFDKFRFTHAFRESQSRHSRDKMVFSEERAERIDWIEWALENPNATLRQGWDYKKKKFDPMVRVAIIPAENYVVVAKMKKNGTAFFITAYKAGRTTIGKIMNNPAWPSK